MSAILLAFVLFSPAALAAPKKGKASEPEVALSDAGKALEAKYLAMQASLKSEIEAVLPKIDDAKVSAWMSAITEEEVAAKQASAKSGEVSKLEKTGKTLKQLELSATLPPKTYAEAKEELVQAKALGKEDPKKDKLLESEASYLAYLKSENDLLKGRIDKAKIAFEQAKAALPEATKAADAAEQLHQKAMAKTWQAMDALGANGVLGSDKMDGKLALYTVINSATPRRLAQFAEKSAENEKLLQQLFADEALMIQMLVADGPNSGKFGEAMKIYTDIQKASDKAKSGVFQRLALAVSLGHAVPIVKRSSAGDGVDEETSDASGSANFIDPVKRYLSYEKWYLDGELQPGFKDLSVWNLVMATDATDPDEVLAWGREALNNLRPDCIPRDGDTSVYVDVVDKEIAYTSANVKDDRPDVAVMQNILANGGICGRRAFYGRFTLHAFGVPTTARKQPGHATLAHWHPDGWKTRLGGNWGLGARGNYSAMNSTRSNSYGADVNFLASSQARGDETAFMRVKRAQWIGALLGEPIKPGLITYSGKSRAPSKIRSEELGRPIFWNELALHEQRRIIAGLKPAKTESPATASAESKAPGATGQAAVDDKGVITIPASACSSPTASTTSLSKSGVKDIVVFVKDMAGETHLHYSRYAAESDSFEYTFDAPKGGSYELVAKVVTPKPNQSIIASVNGGADVEIPLPYTIGLWDKTAPIKLELKAGKNALKFRGPTRATFKNFTLTPVK